MRLPTCSSRAVVPQGVRASSTPTPRAIRATECPRPPFASGASICRNSNRNSRGLVPRSVGIFCSGDLSFPFAAAAAAAAATALGTAATTTTTTELGTTAAAATEPGTAAAATTDLGTAATGTEFGPAARAF
jgi:hypothetical protein